MISAVVLTKNEEKNIKACSESLHFCDEIIVIDDNSTDNTREIAKKLGAKVLVRDLTGDFAGQRNFGLKNARGEWVLFVDADERVPDALASEICNLKFSIFNENGYEGFYIKRVDMLWGKELSYGEVGNTQLIRFARKDAGKWKRRVHEYWDIKGRVGVFNSPLLHYPHQTVGEFIDRVDFYSTLHAQEKNLEGEHSDVITILLWPVFKFLHNWLAKQGFLDDTEGFVVAMMMSFHSFLAWSKLWLMKK